MEVRLIDCLYVIASGVKWISVGGYAKYCKLARVFFTLARRLYIHLKVVSEVVLGMILYRECFDIEGDKHHEDPDFKHFIHGSGWLDRNPPPRPT